MSNGIMTRRDASLSALDTLQFAYQPDGLTNIRRAHNCPVSVAVCSAGGCVTLNARVCFNDLEIHKIGRDHLNRIATESLHSPVLSATASHQRRHPCLQQSVHRSHRLRMPIFTIGVDIFHVMFHHIGCFRVSPDLNVLSPCLSSDSLTYLG